MEEKGLHEVRKWFSHNIVPPHEIVVYKINKKVTGIKN